MPTEEARVDLLRHRRDIRTQLAHLIYDATGPLPAPHGRVLAASLELPDDWTDEDAHAAIRWLEGAGYVKIIATGPTIGLTIEGIESIEQAIAPEDDPLAAIDAVELRAIEAFITKTERAVDTGEVTGDEETLQEIRDLLQALSSQLGRKPRRKIVVSILSVLGQLAISTAGSVGGPPLATEIARLLHR